VRLGAHKYRGRVGQGGCRQRVAAALRRAWAGLSRWARACCPSRRTGTPWATHGPAPRENWLRGAGL